MKTISLFVLSLISAAVYAQEDYIVEVNGQKMSVALDKEYSATVDGKAVTFKVSSKDTLTYVDRMFSFQHSKEYKPVKTALDSGVSQVAMLTAEGSGFVIQKFESLSPVFLSEMMLNEVIKESVDYGYELQRQDYKRKLASGEEVQVARAVLTYHGDKSIYEVVSFGGKDEGILVMTMISDDSMAKDGKVLINTMWKSLKYKP